MAVYDRSMFRGSRPTPQAQGAGDAVAEKFVSEVGNRVVSDAQQGIASAKDYVGVMNAMRGDERTMKERRSELGGIVGMKDANKTPESVVTLVQPVMQMREAQGSVDEGIGQMAQKAMDTPVEGNMAGGIMQPLQLAPGGAVSLKRLYQENLPMMREIYGDQTADLKKQAIGQLLLGGVAPAGLAIAQGTPVAEALMAVGPYAAQLAGGVSEAKRKQDAAERSGAFELAQAQQTAAAAKKAKEEEISYAPAGSAITKGTGEVIGYVPEKSRAAGATAMYRYTGTRPLTVEGYGTIQPGASLPIGANELSNFGEARQFLQEVKEPPKPLAAGAQQLYRNTSDVAIETPGGTVQPGKEISLGSNELAKVTNRTALQPVTEDTSALTKDMVFKGPAVMNGVTYKAGDIVPPMSIKAYNALTEENPTLAGKMASLQAYDRDKLPSPEILFSVDANNNRIQKAVFTQKGLSDALNEGFSTEDDSTYVPQPMVMLTPSGKTLTKTPKTLAEMKIAAGEGYVNFDPSMMRTVGNKLISVFPTGTTVNFSSMDPIPLFNSKGEKKVITNETELMAAYNAPDPFYLKTPPSKDVTKKKAYGELIPLTTKLEQWADGTPGVDWTPQDQREFDTYLSAVQSATVIGPSAANPDTYEVQRPVVPDYIIGALAKARLKDPEFPSYGLLPMETATIQDIAQKASQTPSLIKEINYADKVGFGNWFARNADRVVGFVREGFGANYSPLFPESSEAVSTMNALMIQTRTSALADLTGKQTEGIRQEINGHLFDPASPFLTTQDARDASKSMSDTLSSAIQIKEVEYEQTSPSNTARRDRLKASIVNLSILRSNWVALAEDFSNVSRGTMDPNNLPRTTK